MTPSTTHRAGAYDSQNCPMYDSKMAQIEQDTVRRVDRAMRGREVGLVERELVARLRERACLPGSSTS